MKPLGFNLPGTREYPPMRLEGPVVPELPATADPGDLVTFGNMLWFWDGDRWQPYWTEEAR